MVQKIDLRKDWKHLYNPSARHPELITVPPLRYLMIDGKGSPNTSVEYQEAVTTLFPMAYAIKFAIKKREGIDYSVMPLEGQWWGTPEEMLTFTEDDKEKWSWTAMILQPDWVSKDLYNEILFDEVNRKRLPAIEKVRLDTLDEGLSVQMMHIGPYATEAPTSEAMHRFAHQQGYKLSGHHHEIYLKDPRRTSPEKLMTVLRHPLTWQG
jgi:hypothetical protein